MVYQKIISVTILTVIYLGCVTTLSFGQDIRTTTTNYSKTNDGNIGQENYSFSFNNGTITITDLDYNRTENYEPVKLTESGFYEDNFYYEIYVPDIEKDPVNWRKFNNNIRNYKFVFDRKNGNLIIVIEIKAKANNSRITKIFYTQQGYTLTTIKSNTQNQNSSNFDLADILISSSSLYQITNQIKSVYKPELQRHYSYDLAFYSYTYNNGDEKAIINYSTSNNEIQFIAFQMHRDKSIQVSNASFISNFIRKQMNGYNDVWVNVKTGLEYELRLDDITGTIIVR